MKPLFKDEAEKRRYLRFYAYLSKYPDIKAIYAQVDAQEQDERRKGVIEALSVAFDLFEERENEINQKAIADFVSECKDLKKRARALRKDVESVLPRYLSQILTGRARREQNGGF